MNNTNRKRLDIAMIFVIVLCSFLYRRFDAFSNPQLWAEDGSQILQGWESLHFSSIFVIYAGYFSILPRIIAAIIGILHVSYYYIPLVYNLSAFIVTFLVAFALWQDATKLNIKHSVFFATLFVLLPVGNELFMNEACLCWITGIYLINYVFTWNNKINEKYYFTTLILLFIFSLSGPYSSILSPVIVIVIFANRKEVSLKRLIPLLVILIGGLTQVISLKFIHPEAYSGRVESWNGAVTDHFHLLKLFTKNTSQIFGLDNISGISVRIKTILSLVIFIGLVIIFIFSYRRIETKRKYVLLLSAVLFFGSFIVTYWPKESKILSLEIARYYFFPYTCIGWLMIIAWDKEIKFIYIAIYLFLLSRQNRYLKTPLPDKKWKEQIKEYYDGKRDTIDINPDGWHVVLLKR